MKRVYTTAAALAAVSLMQSSATVGQTADVQDWPEPDAQAVWSYIQQQEYEENWALWPGTSKLYEGTEPHGMLLTTYVNSTAENALAGLADQMPRGSIIVKENYMPTEELAAVTVMYKASDGYNPEHNNWFWLKRLADGTVETSGKAESCQSCHGVSENDYLRTALPES